VRRTTCCRSYEQGGPQALEPRRRGRPPGAGRSTLPVPLQAEIVRTKRRFPTFGLKKVRDFLKRFGGKSVSTGSVRKVLAAEGLHQPIEPTRRRKREIVRRFERSKPGELWQTDITSYVLTRSRVRVYLTVFLDDFSRYVVSWSLATHQRSALVCEALMEGIERFGKPEEVLSDQGRQYFAWRGKSDFQRLLVREGIRHVVSRTHHPETLGKCERLWETIGTELWQRTQPQDLGEARERLAHYFAHYNHFRPHQGIGGYVPADRFFGAERTVRLALEERMARDELAEALSQTPRKGVYVFGQVGDQSVSLHGERGRIVLVTSEGVHKELALEDLGLPQKEKDDDDDRIDDDGRDDGSAARATREEAAGLPAAEAGAGLGACTVGVGEPGGAEPGARDVRGDPVDVAGPLDARAGGERALAAAAAGVAVEPGGGVWDARGPLEAAPGPGQGDGDGSEQRGRPEGSAQAHRGAGGGEQVLAPAHGGAEEPARSADAPCATSPAETGDQTAWKEIGRERGTASS
jgi:transposase InsO family protein